MLLSKELIHPRSPENFSLLEEVKATLLEYMQWDRHRLLYDLAWKKGDDHCRVRNERRKYRLLKQADTTNVHIDLLPGEEMRGTIRLRVWGILQPWGPSLRIRHPLRMSFSPETIKTVLGGAPMKIKRLYFEAFERTFDRLDLLISTMKDRPDGERNPDAISDKEHLRERIGNEFLSFFSGAA